MRKDGWIEHRHFVIDGLGHHIFNATHRPIARHVTSGDHIAAQTLQNRQAVLEWLELLHRTIQDCVFQ